MKLSKQELKQKISDSITDNDDLVISLLEDIEDSMTEDNAENIMDETAKKELEELKLKYDYLKAKYKERFLSGKEKDPEDEKDEKDEGLEEKEVIDVKEI